MLGIQTLDPYIRRVPHVGHNAHTSAQPDPLPKLG